MERKHMAFFQLKMVLGPCVETLILLDRLAYLLEQARPYCLLLNLSLAQRFSSLLTDPLTCAL